MIEKDYVTKSAFKEKMNKMVNEFREQNQRYLKGTYKPPSKSDEKPVPKEEVKQKPEQMPKMVSMNNVDHRKKAYERRLNKY